ncbi:hypothetical protein [Pyxidicoccus xibeiensis]|uniref:hypothetical protein n=1 Tax=Pyxidicoccus xibeiensis TaxID=2906759 RepID=UPI0020A8333C|nr:hypothetical protein [Pyxidicoccus xibeiensis]MCP3136474.1 hypothetical protein [Pyxidicoccus xibeiensis]
MAVLAVGLAACGGDDEGVEVKKEEFGARVVQAFCAREARCGVYASADACEQDRLAWGWDRSWGLGTRYDEALEDGRLSYDAEAAGRCVAALRDGDCRVAPLSQTALMYGLEYDPACQVLRTEEPAEACAYDLECGEQGQCRYRQDNACAGACEPRPKEGEPAFTAQCVPGLIRSGFNGVCRRPIQEGGSCVETQGGFTLPLPCEEGLWCDADGSGKCQRTGSEGDACEDLRFGSTCGAAFFCKDGRCSRRARQGEACSVPGPTTLLWEEQCQGELFCDAAPGASGTCQARGAEGASCRETVECAVGLTCLGVGNEQAPGVQGTCGTPRGPGERCERYENGFSNCAASHGCSDVSGTCVPFVNVGERCGSEGLCVNGMCSDEGRCVPIEAFVCR